MAKMDPVRIGDIEIGFRLRMAGRAVRIEPTTIGFLCGHAGCDARYVLPISELSRCREKAEARRWRIIDLTCGARCPKHA